MTDTETPPEGNRNKEGHQELMYLDVETYIEERNTAVEHHMFVLFVIAIALHFVATLLFIVAFFWRSW